MTTQKGLIIIVMNQCTRIANGKAIHSSGQMEHYKITVKDQAFAITNVTPYIELPEGYRTPLCFVNGLPHMKMCAHNDKEWSTRPHVAITSDAPWDPRILDLTPPDEQFLDQPKCLELIEESTHYEHGTYKKSLTTYPKEDAEHVLDAEKTNDDPNYNQNGERLANSPIEVSRANIKVYLHNLVHDETAPEHRVFRVSRHLHKVDIDYQEAHPATSRHSPRDHPSFAEQPAKRGTITGRRSPRDHPSSSERAAKCGTKKKRMQHVQPEPNMILDTPLKTMDGNPLRQGKDISPDDQDGSRTDYYFKDGYEPTKIYIFLTYRNSRP